MTKTKTADFTWVRNGYARTNTEATLNRNQLRAALWANTKLAHDWVCHEGDSKRCDGNTCWADPDRAEFYQSELESV